MELAFISFFFLKKFRLMGLKIALAAKLREGRFHLVDSFSTTSHKTQIVKKLVEDKIGKVLMRDWSLFHHLFGRWMKGKEFYS